MSRVTTQRHSTSSSDFSSSILYCQSCMDVPEFPVTLCKGGHTVCNKCRNKKPSCGICRGEFTNIRNLVCESLISKTRFKCKYVMEGCNLLIKGAEYHSHIKDCMFRPIHCRLTPCDVGASVALQNYPQHIRIKHGITGRVASETLISQSLHEILTRQNVPSSTSNGTHGNARGPGGRVSPRNDHSTLPCFYLHCSEEIFFLNTLVSDECIFWWVTMLNPTEINIKRYRTKLLLKTGNADSFQSVQWTGRVYSVSDSFGSIADYLTSVFPVRSMRGAFNTASQTQISRDPDITWDILFSIEDTMQNSAQNSTADDSSAYPEN